MQISLKLRCMFISLVTEKRGKCKVYLPSEKGRAIKSGEGSLRQQESLTKNLLQQFFYYKYFLSYKMAGVFECRRPLKDSAFEISNVPDFFHCSNYSIKLKLLIWIFWKIKFILREIRLLIIRLQINFQVNINCIWITEDPLYINRSHFKVLFFCLI